MKQILYLLFGLSLLYSCSKSGGSATTQLSPVDSLVGNWVKNWNTHDSTAIKNMFESDALLIDDKLMTKNRDELASKWIRPNIDYIRNLKAEKVREWVTDDRACFVGTYELDIIVMDAPMEHHLGVWTVNWKKNENGEWKITNAHISTTAG